MHDADHAAGSDDEFSFLAEQAAERGIPGPLPRGRRVAVTLPDGAVVSGLLWGERPEVTFLHGAGLNAHTWDTTIAALGRDSLALDLPGHGHSSWRTDADYRGSTLAPAVAAALDEWTDVPQVLVGHSLGGLTAAAVAATRPDLVRETVIVDITPGVDPSAGPAQIRAFFAGPTDWATRDELVDKAMAAGLGGGTRRRVERGVFFNSRVRPDGRVEWRHHFAHLAAQAATGEPAADTDTLARALSTEGWVHLAQARSPLTLVRATRGFVTPADAADFARRIPTAQVVAVDTGHNAQEEDPIALADLVLSRLPA
jgi:pimeloyl-ACP methyl ester carboxylesterase